jgi:hypothetical protein
MSAEYAAFSRPALSASDFQRDEPAAEAGAFAPTPIYARTAARRSRVNPAVWAILPVAALAIGVGAYVMNQPKDDLMVSTAPPPAAASIETPKVADTTPTMAPEAPAKDVQTFKSESVRTQVAQVAKPAARKAVVAHRAASAATAGADASAAVPATPMPYAPSAQTSAPAPAPVMAAPPAASVVTPEPAAPATPTPETTPQPEATTTPQA